MTSTFHPLPYRLLAAVVAAVARAGFRAARQPGQVVGGVGDAR